MPLLFRVGAAGAAAGRRFRQRPPNQLVGRWQAVSAEDTLKRRGDRLTTSLLALETFLAALVTAIATGLGGVPFLFVPRLPAAPTTFPTATRTPTPLPTCFHRSTMQNALVILTEKKVRIRRW